MADGTASPHLVLAALFAAMADGVENSMTLPTPQGGEGDAAPNTDRHSPHDLPDALDALEQDQVLVEALGEDLVACFVKIKRAECARWAAAVTDWEHQEYGRFF